ncbi:transcriptional regulator [Cupriavidus sp. DF5525]|uniref:transcriptional regulator n=1 Tax=Cupriavidus sp. DF5525 TaxID=3160989 RepID=UPI0032DFE394
MDAKTFLKQFGSEEAARVSEVAGTNYAYFSQIAHGHRRPSVKLAQRLVLASEGKLDFVSLLQSKDHKTTAAESAAAPA